MKLLLLFLSLLPVAAHAVNGSGNVSSVKQLCGSAISVPTNDVSYISLHAFRIPSSTNGVTPLYRDGVQYQVPNNKNFLVECVEWGSDTGSQTGNMQLISGTTGAGTVGGTVTYEFGATSIYAWPVTSANTIHTKGHNYRFDENLFPGIQGSTTPSHWAIVHGREVDDLP